MAAEHEIKSRAWQLDWEQVQAVIESRFEDEQDRRILLMYFGLGGFAQSAPALIGRMLKIKTKTVQTRLDSLVKELYRHLKREDLNRLIQERWTREKSCGAVVVRETEECRQVLLLKHLAGHWSYPKGHVEDGESEQQTALREIKEETGLSVKLIPGFRKSVTFSPAEHVIKDVIYFLARPLDGNLKAQPEEIETIAWVDLTEAEQTLTYDDDRELLRQVRHFLEAQ